MVGFEEKSPPSSGRRAGQVDVEFKSLGARPRLAPNEVELGFAGGGDVRRPAAEPLLLPAVETDRVGGLREHAVVATMLVPRIHHGVFLPATK